MKIFVTGGGGFIGSNLCAHLLGVQENSVTVFDNFSNGRREFLEPFAHDARFKIIEGDMLNGAALVDAISGHDSVIHLAANADIAASASQTDLDLKQTVLATFNILDAMRLQKVGKIIYSSGSGVYGDIGEYAPQEDYGPLLPVSMYGATKLGAEALICAFSHLFGVQARIFRFANVIGPHQTHGVGYDFIRKLRKDPARLEILGNGLQSKSYIHVDDVINAIAHVAALETSPLSIHNVGTGDYITVRRIAELVVEEMALTGVRMTFGDTPFGWKGDVPVVRLNDNKLRKSGWAPKYGSEEAMRRSLRQMLEYM
jgi:UDP-glucose 4-epimerase